MTYKQILQESPIWGLMDKDMRLDCLDHFKKACKKVGVKVKK